MYSCFYESKLVVWRREKKKNEEDDENVLFKALAKKFLWKVVHGRPSIKWASWKGNEY